MSWGFGSSRTSASLLVTALGVATILIVKHKCDKKLNDKRIEATYSRRERILRGEVVGLYAGLTSLVTCTWFKGNSTEAADFFESRLEKLLEANPWLSGRVEKYKGTYYLAYNEESVLDISAAMKEIFILGTEKDCKGINPNSSAEEVTKVCHSIPRVIVKNPRLESQLRVSILPSGDDHFALIFSLSHISGDGFTFYRIYKMLVDPDSHIEAMETKRFHETEELRNEVMGAVRERKIAGLGFVYFIAIGSAYETFRQKLFPTKRKAESFLVDLKIIDQMKKEHLENPRKAVPYISTNDIIASWFFRNCGTTSSHLAVNFRGKLKGHTDNMSGNYGGSLFYSVPQEVETPEMVRKTVNTLRKPKESFASPRDTFKGGHAMLTNWVSLSGTKPQNPPNCEELFHFPVAVEHAMGPMGAVAVVHRYGPGKIAVRTSVGRKLPESLEVPEFGKRLDL